MHKSKLKRVSIAVCMALMPISIFAAGLGKLNVSSGLGEPLRADIELISVTPDELSSISASIANEEAYATQGIERPTMHNNIQIELAKSSAGTPILRLKTNQPVNDPFLDMLIQVDWASGRLLREYTVLLDPPGYSSQTDKSNISQPVQAPTVRQSNTNNQLKSTGSSTSPMIRPAHDSAMTEADMSDSPRSRTKKSAKRIKARPEAQLEIKPDAEVESAQDTYKIKHGDTLGAIAKEMQVSGVNLDQMLVGLNEANPKAFNAGNMNRLKAGQIIRVPSAENLAALSPKQAHAEVKLQSDNWNAYRNKLAGMVATSSTTAEDTNKESTGGKVTTAAEDKAAEVKTGPKDVVKLSSGNAAESNANASAAAKAAEAKIAMQEDAIAKDKALKEEQDKAAALARIQEAKDLLALKNKQLADLQKQAKENAAKPAPALVAKPPAPVPAVPAKPVITPPLTPEPAKVETAKTVPTPVPVPAPVVTPTPATPPVAALPNKPVAAAPKIDKTKAPVVTPPPAQEPPSFLDDILSGIDVTILSMGAVVLALLAGAWLFLRNKRKRNLADFEQGILTSGGLKANTVFGNTSGGKVDTGDTSFLTDFSQSSSGSMIDTNDVDPIAEAEVYMAYGREAQAEEILKDAIVKEPKRYELHLKLLEMYAGRKDTAAYETIAGELYTTLGAHDPIWAKVAEMGAAIEADNPLYQSVGPISTPTAAMDQTTKLDASDFANIGELGSGIEDSQDIDFSINTPDNDPLADLHPTRASSTSSEETSGFDFDLGTLDSKPATSAFEESLTDFQPLVDEPNAFETKSDTGMEFNLTDFGSFAEPAETIQPVEHIESAPTMVDEDRFSHTLPSFSVAEIAPISAPPVEEAISLTEINFDLPNFESPQASSQEAAEELDFDFSVPEMSEDFSEAISFDSEEIPISEAKTLDFSGISLDLDQPEAFSSTVNGMANDTSNFEMPEIATISTPDSADVDTKLELVSAYLEMEDSEGAKELLEEVLKEGSSRQIAKAKEMLANIV